MEPFLLDSFTIKNLPSPEKLRRTYLAREFGMLRREQITSDKVKNVRAALREPGLAREWERCVAEELLLRRATGEDVQEPVLRAFAHVEPFDEGPPLGELALLNCAAALIPVVDTHASAPTPMHLWVVQGVSHVPSLDGSAIVTNGYGCYLLTEDGTMPHGRSWQLGYRIARRALEQNDKATAANLALRWLPSGVVGQDDRIGKIVIGNKLDTLRPDNGERCFILPRENSAQQEDWDKMLARGVRTAPDVSTAWSVISATGTLEAREPVVIDRGKEVVLHSFVSNAWEPVVALTLLLKPSKLYLWSSREAQEMSLYLVDLMAEVARRCGFGTPPSIETPDIHSSNITEAERQLDAVLHNATAEQQTFFNITQGNLPMRYAVNTAARKQNDVTLIYRNIDDPAFEHICLQFQDTNTIMRRLDTGRLNYPGIRWEKLFAFPKLRSIARPAGSPEEQAKGLFSA